MNNKQFIDVKVDAVEMNEFNVDPESKGFNRKFYDSTIIKSIHSIGQKNNLDKLYFELLLEYDDEVVSLEFNGVSDILSESTLSYFPEIREIKILDVKKDLTCHFIPMWGNKVISFKFDELKAVSYILTCKKRGVILGSV